MDKNIVKNKFSEIFNDEPLLFRSPGRVNLIGEHTDYNDGFVLPAAIDKEVIVAIKKKEGSQCSLYACDLDETFHFDLNKVTRSDNGWANYILGVVAQLQKAGHKISAFDCAFGGNIPLGAGLSSSAALECVFAYALNEINNLNIDRLTMVKMAQKAEHEYAGVQCGIMDQFASMFGKKDHVFRLDCRSLEYNYFPFKLDNYDVVLCDTNVSHSLASSEYNTRRKECETGVELLKKHFPDITSLRDISIDQLEKHKNEFDPTVYKRCHYVVSEIERVVDSCDKLEKGDLLGFGENMYKTHEGLSRDYEVSCKELDFLVAKTLVNDNVIGARMMGGGFGGCTINLVQKNATKQFIKEMTQAYKDDLDLELKTYIVSIEDGSSKY